MTKGFLESTKTKKILFKRKLTKRTEENTDKYKKYNTVYNKIKRIIIKTYYQSKLAIYKHDMKNTWTTIREILGNKKQTVSGPPNMIKIENEQITDKHKIVEQMNDYFSTIGAKLSEHQGTCQDHNKYMNKIQNQKTIFITPTTPDEIKKITQNFKSKTSKDAWDISTKLMKQTIGHIIDPITHIMNLSLTSGEIPENMKITKTIPIHKSGDKDKLNNYRPISLLPAFSKILEKLMYNRITNFLEKMNYFICTNMASEKNIQPCTQYSNY